ncbi:DUF1963 domain-containing protein [Spirulina subsalsa FACHB-351]|uniref:DUF1963 domain-containing protein n=1 Tax=Spirulina subsalsa FACHB-351 TaxID=234711 RepID=A0ABT3L0K3_9CYAN|nr:YwqG family protein [Spirulina subsalsa]MCW6035028.1 DUF1963 domain-containing protein [Spirulina subsalsa FACHB-351]
MIDPNLIAKIPQEFAQVKPFLEQNLLPYIAITCEEQGSLDSACDPDLLLPWETKLGGYPYLPKGMDYPKDEETDRFLMFLGQIDCADVPELPGFNLPKQGLLQFYTGYIPTMGEWRSTQHYIRYFPEVSKDEGDLITDFSFLEEERSYNEWYYDVYRLRFSLENDVFFDYRSSAFKVFHPLDTPEELKSVWEEFYYDWFYEQKEHMTLKGNGKLGGYPEVHSYVPETLESAEGQLLLELEHPYDGVYFYFFIDPQKLTQADFSEVSSYVVAG